MAPSWITEPLGDLVEEIVDRRGITPLKLGSDFVPTGYRVISAKAIKGRRVDLAADEPRFVNAETYHKWMKTPLLADDVILTSEAPLGEPAYVSKDFEWCLGQRLFGIRTRKDKLHGRFLFYALQSASVRHDLLSRATGTTAEGIRQSELRRVLVPHPEVDEQRAIADVLGALDDKRNINRQVTETLERLVRTIFKSWFVEFGPVRAKAAGRDPGLPKRIADLFPDSFEDSELGEIPRGWKVGSFGDVAEHPRRGVRPNDIEPSTPYIALEHMPRGSIALADWDSAGRLESNKFEFKRGEILFGKLRPYFHKVGIAPIDGVCSTDIVVVTPLAAHWRGFTLGHISSDAFVDHTSAGSTGTKMPRTSWGEMSRYKVVLPDEPVASVFTEQVLPAIGRILTSIHESRTLAALRDILLPKLISGELSVKSIDRAP
jgi:type I restriction enzyme S subunit